MSILEGWALGATGVVWGAVSTCSAVSARIAWNLLAIHPVEQTMCPCPLRPDLTASPARQVLRQRLGMDSKRRNVVECHRRLFLFDAGQPQFIEISENVGRYSDLFACVDRCTSATVL